MPRATQPQKRRVLRFTAAAVCVLALAGQSLTAYAAPVIPSAGQVQQAQQQAAAKGRQVAAIQTRLSAAATELDRRQVAAQLAGQAYNAAVEKLDAAKVVARQAVAASTAAQRQVTLARADVGQLARTQVQSSGPLVDLASLATAAGPQQLIDRLDTFDSTSAVLQGKLLRLQRLERAATTAQVRATAAQANVQQATDAAATAKLTASTAATAQQQAVNGYATRRTQLIGELAQAQQVSVAVARQRQVGLEALARAKAEAQRKAAERAQAERERLQRQREAAALVAAQAKADRLVAERAAARRAARAASVRARAARPSSRSSSAATRSTREATTKTRTTTSTRTSTRTSSKVQASPTQRSQPVSSPTGGGGYHSGAARRAIAFAKAQLGEPYVFGATGPSTWDCSGLTMRAYEQSGYEIGHFTGTQWGNVHHISQSALRPGDLLFWGDGSDPSSIYHTALYLGNGMMIQAPRPGRGVEIVSMYYWTPPNLFGRV